MDDFLEQIVVRKRRGAMDALYYLTWPLIILCAFFGLINLTGILYTGEGGALAIDWAGIVRAAAGLGAAFGLWKAGGRLRVEYDYSFTNGALDVAQVLNGRRRVPLTSVNMRDLRAAGEAAGPAYGSASRAAGVKLHKWYLNKGAKLFFFAFERKGARHLMLLELSEEMAQLIFSRRYMSPSIWDGAYRGL